MKGSTLIYRVGADPEVKVWNETNPDLKFLQGAVGGLIQIVPYFDSIEIDGIASPCVVYCDEEGKLTGKVSNTRATILWDRALRRIKVDGKPMYPTGLLDRRGKPTDMLVGAIVVVTGDEEFLTRHIEGE